MTIYKPGCVDSNILVYAAFQDSIYFEAAKRCRDQALNGETHFYLTPQILAEFFAIITDPRRVSPAHTHKDAFQEVEKYLNAPGFILLPTPAEVVVKWIELGRQHPMKSQEIFDVQIVASMLLHNIHTIYTFNKADFEKFEEIEVIVPS